MRRGCDFSSHAGLSLIHHTQACSYSMHRSWICASLSCVPDVHTVSGYPVFSKAAVSASYFPISFRSFPDTQIRSHLHDSPMHILQLPLRSFCLILYSDVWCMPTFPLPAQIHVPSGISGSVPVCGTYGLFHWGSQ